MTTATQPPAPVPLAPQCRLSQTAARQIVAALDEMATEFAQRAESVPGVTSHPDWLLGAEMLVRRLGIDIDGDRSQRVLAAELRRAA